MQTYLPRGTMPSILLIDSEADILADLAVAALGKSQQAAKLLLQEVDRASTVARADLPTDVVTMQSRVVFVDEATAEQHSVELVYPRDANMELGRLSVLTPIGAALIGMTVGNSIDWPNRQGACRRLKIVDVVQPAPVS